MKIAILFCLCFSSFLYSEEPNDYRAYNSLEELFLHQPSPDFALATKRRKKKSTPLSLSRTDQIPKERLKKERASYLEGYIQALIDANYHELNVLVHVDEEETVFLYNLPKNDQIKQSIIAYVKDLPHITKVKEAKLDPEMKNRIKEKKAIRQINGVWFPESTVLFQPLIANPRDPIYSVAYRGGDFLAKHEIAISLGDTFPIFRWFDVLPWHGDMQIDIAACVWGIFDIAPKVHPNGEWAELITTDYLLEVPLSYAVDKWSFRLRAYHISSHLGDEYMVNHANVIRLNPSFEALDIFASYQATGGIRLYVGPGVIVNSDKGFPMKRFYFGYGLEWRFKGFRYHYHKLHGSPFLAFDIQQWQINYFRPSATAQLGYEWSKLKGAGRKVRIFGEYHDGYGEGQFLRVRSRYFAIRLSWGF